MTLSFIDMKKKYTQPDILLQRFDSRDLIMTSPGVSDDGATGDPVLAPKHTGIWDEED